MSQTIKYSFWLRFSKHGGLPRTFKNNPAIAVDERAMHCVVELPRTLFARPQLTARIVVDENAQEPPHIDVAAVENMLAGAIGAEVRVTVTEPVDEMTVQSADNE